MPPIYREIYEICSYNDEPVEKDVYKNLLTQSKLDAETLKVIWELAGPSQGTITRTSLYKTLALISWAQQGKDPSNKLFSTFNGKGMLILLTYETKV